jgi:DNA-binding NtrC family response regulator
MSSPVRLLVVEDHESERRGLSKLLKADGMQVFEAQDADKAMGYIDEDIDVVLSDLNMGDVSGIDLLTLWKQHKPDTQFILITAQTSVASAVEAMKKGAHDYVTKPINPDELCLLIRRAVQDLRKDQEIDHLRRRLDQKFGLDPGRKRHRQGTGGPGAAPQQPAKKGAVRGDQLRGGPRHTHRERIVRARPRGLHRGYRPAHGPLRSG